MSEVNSTEKTEAERAKRLKWYYKNREKANAANKKWREENRDRRNETRKAWYALKAQGPEFREKRNEQARKRKKANPEKTAAQQRSYRVRNPERLKTVARRNHLRRMFGMTVEEYDALMAAQGGRCAICGTDDPAPHKCLSVDHDHKTGAVRGLLCFHCNAGLGHFRDDRELLTKGLDYLRRHDAGHPQDD